ncbi:peptide-methionine (R)-S-oxide reductase [Leptospira stimsonii]|uniref:Peptide methionine sulfoxide reductase MsrB n=2 Tax=Leptospira stimsonii TaxID=2202203 RepID=A0ABY2MU36_9LEPT|nr:peptide-methionine (R)-S-oxide reductase [Leptospira stimsonii]TGM07897.1 peptide-methionine (R)-S-oxide reductase [Leptospira stimsonii]
MEKKILLTLVSVLFLFTSCAPVDGDDKAKKKGGKMKYEVNKSEEEWKRELTPEQYKILRQKGTEMAFTGALYKNHEKGTYLCAACGAALFSSETKYESGSGWPSFYQPAKEEAVEKETDSSHGMTRTEVVCARCGGHLGHVFPDGPRPTGLRYCINSASLKFKKE